MIKVQIKRVRPSSNPLPQYQTDHAAGVDVIADIDQPVILEPGQRKLIPTGLAMEIPVGYEAQVRPRSGLAIKKGISLVNSPGTIDADYRGEVQIILINHGSEVFELQPKERIAQIVFAPVTRVEFEEVDELSDTNRGEGGFGSTGNH